MSQYIFTSIESSRVQRALAVLKNSVYDRPLDEATVNALRPVARKLGFGAFGDLAANAPLTTILQMIYLAGGAWHDPISPIVPA